ncbi:hypothetical protein A4X09_0g2936 [Tilletia walkeri]|uniref:Uncharacterized protein n=1 Tax=Tilletia walkeri TaxID=117179 RepID=A0A8X7NA18_9BASI|nr:hypothetical protein A4X09_0g2936 [Tilletia walkeri]
MTAPPSLSKPDNDDPIVDLPAVPASSVSRAKQTIARRAATPHHEDTDEEVDGLDIDPTRINTNPFAEMWPSERVVKLVKANNYVPMWYFTAAGCRQAAKERRDESGQTMFWQESGGTKAAGHPDSLVEDHHLAPLDFHNATSLWVEVATRVKVSKRVLDSMILLNHDIFNSQAWRTEPVSTIKLHDHQRSTWSKRRHQRNAGTMMRS